MQYTPLSNATNAAAEKVATMRALQDGATAMSLLPADTRFAVVIEGIIKGINDSFYETDLNLATGITRSPEGVVGRFVGYLTFTDTQVRIYRALDVGVAAQSGATTDLVSSGNQLESVFESALTDTGVSFMQDSFVISNAQLQCKLLQPLPIGNVDGHFVSSATGLYGGFQSAFNYMKEHGTQTQTATRQSKIISIVIILLIVAGTVAVIMLGHKK